MGNSVNRRQSFSATPKITFKQDICKLSWTESFCSGCSNEGSSTGYKLDNGSSEYYERWRISEKGSSIRCLSLAYEDLTSVPLSNFEDEMLNTVQVLDLSNNKINDLRFLSDFERLSTVNLDRNQVNCLTVFPPMHSLHTLWLNNNRILSPVPFLSSLAQQCPNLKVLSLMGNELCPNYLNGGTEQQYEIYRLQVIRYFPKLKHLDDSAVSYEERQKILEPDSVNTVLESTGQQSSIGSLDEGIEVDG